MTRAPSLLAALTAGLLVPAAAGLIGCSAVDRAAPPKHVDFVTHVKPVLEHFCLECHNPDSARTAGGLNLETRRTAMTTGRHAPVIRPGNPDASLLLRVLRLGHEHELAMPPAPDKVSDHQLADVREWIRQGAGWPDGPDGRLRPPPY
jgi:hypothetical protein